MTQAVDHNDVELVVLLNDQEVMSPASLTGLRAAVHRGESLTGERWRATLVTNGSIGGAASVAEDLASSVDDVDVVRLPGHLGRGDLRARWANSATRTVVFLELAPDTDFDSVLDPVLEHFESGQTATTERFALGGLLNRRTALTAIGGLGLTALLAACAGGSTSTAERSTSSSTKASPSTPHAQSSTTTAAVHPVALAPEIIEGPYYLDLKNVRSNIVEDRKGAPLALNLVIVNAADGAPVKGAAVDIWHADADGLYSGFVKTSAGVNNTTASSADDGTFLRGTQISDRLGQVAFATIYPGWYSGRAVHIHVKVRTNGKAIHTGQLYFDDALTDNVFASVAPYSGRAERDVRNATDSFYGTPGRMSTLAVAKRGDGYTTTMTLGTNPI